MIGRVNCPKKDKSSKKGKSSNVRETKGTFSRNIVWQATLNKHSLFDSSDPVECQELLVEETNLLLLMPCVKS